MPQIQYELHARLHTVTSEDPGRNLDETKTQYKLTNLGIVSHSCVTNPASITMFKQIIVLALLTVTGFAGAQDASITWTSDTSYDDRQAAVGDTVTFTYQTNHNVYIHPTGDCSDAGAELVGDNQASPASYTFDESDAGTTVTFACDVADHCETGQIIKFTIPGSPTVSPAPTAAPVPTAAPGSSDDSASAALRATLVVGSVVAAALMI
eukprot:scaffold3857_cov127-Cylindrotheca_fusiformis.AAC.5